MASSEPGKARGVDRVAARAALAPPGAQRRAALAARRDRASPGRAARADARRAAPHRRMVGRRRRRRRRRFAPPIRAPSASPSKPDAAWAARRRAGERRPWWSFGAAGAHRRRRDARATPRSAAPSSSGPTWRCTSSSIRRRCSRAGTRCSRSKASPCSRASAPARCASCAISTRADGWPTPTPGYIDMHDLGDMLVDAGFADPVLDQETITLRWKSAAALLAELRQLGGNTAPDRFARPAHARAGAIACSRALERARRCRRQHRPQRRSRLRSRLQARAAPARRRAGRGLARRNAGDGAPAPAFVLRRCAKICRFVEASRPSMRLRSPLAAAAALQQTFQTTAGCQLSASRHFPGPLRPRRRFASAASPVAGDSSVQWLLRRNCSMTPTQLVAFYLSLCAWSLAIAGAFWWRGATLVMPFAGIEILAVGAALLVYARHAGDRERMTPHARPPERRMHARAAHRPGRFRAGVGPGRAGAWRPLADRALGRGQADRDRPLRPARAAPRARRRAARRAPALRRRAAARRRQRLNNEQQAHVATPMMTMRAFSRLAAGLLALLATTLALAGTGRARPRRRAGGQPARPASADVARSRSTSSGCTTSC